MNITSRISDELQLKLSQVEQTILLLNDKATVPFIARYRKEQTGDLDETHIREIRHLHKYYLELEERRQTVLESIRSQGKLTPDLEQKIRNVSVKTELEDLYLPYRPKRTTRASKAKAAGLEPFSRWLFTLSNPESNIMAEAEKYLNVEKEFDSTDKVIQGACDILAEDIASHANVRKLVRLFTRGKGLFVSAVKKNHAGEKNKIRDVLRLFRADRFRPFSPPDGHAPRRKGKDPDADYGNSKGGHGHRSTDALCSSSQPRTPVPSVDG